MVIKCSSPIKKIINVFIVGIIYYLFTGSVLSVLKYLFTSKYYIFTYAHKHYRFKPSEIVLRFNHLIKNVILYVYKENNKKFNKYIYICYE